MFRYFVEQAKKFDLKPHMCGSIEDFVQQYAGMPARGGLSVLNQLESEIHDREIHLQELNRYSERLTQEYNEKVEFQVKAAAAVIYMCSEWICVETRREGRAHL